MKLEDLAAILGVSLAEVKQQMQGEEVICVNLTERKQKANSDHGVIEVL